MPPLAQRAGSGKCLDLRGGQETTPPSSLEKNPPTSLPSPLPLKKRVKKFPLTPHPRGSGSLRFSSLRPRAPPGPARFRDPPADTGSSPVRGAAESRTSVTWIFTRQGSATPFFPARTVRDPRRTLAEHSVPVEGPSRTLLSAFPGSLF